MAKRTFSIQIGPIEDGLFNQNVMGNKVLNAVGELTNQPGVVSR